MKKLSLVIFLMLAGMISAVAQTVTSSPLPIVLINTDGNATIPDAYKVPGTIKILYVDDTTTNYLSNQNDTNYIHYTGRIGIEKRGSTSANLSKRNYGFETRMSDDSTNCNVSLLGMPEENDWVLNPLNYDNSYLRDPLSYALARRTGHYAPRNHYCEVWVGGNYRGIYALTEKIKCDKGRVNVAKMEDTDNSQPRLSGGYIIKADKTTGGDPVAWTTPARNFSSAVNYIHHYPKPEVVTTAQSTYIHNYFSALQTAMDSSDRSLASGYPALIDIPSFVDFMIIGELSSNVDVYQLSTFFYKDRLGKLCAGPVWDYNAAYGSDPFASPGRSGYNVWQFDNNDNTGSNFWYQLFHDTLFHQCLCRRWVELTAPGAPLCYDSVTAVIDSLNDQISTLVSRDKQRWNYYFNQPSAVQSIKTWLQSRYTWLNSQLTDTVCTLPAVPQLAFTKIHYHPHRYQNFAPDSLEFLGITNLQDTTVSLAGVYLSELGLSYQFPSDATIDSAQEVYIAADTAAFRARYGVEAIGQFARNLNNHSQRLVLSDAWGRTIDDVTYSDDGYWPAEADGDGPFLTLLDPYADNSLATSWSTDTALLPFVCVTPSQLVVSQVSYQRALLSWTADTLQHSWQLALMHDDVTDLYLVDTLPFAVEDLMPATTYRFAVQSLCDASHESEWSDTLAFTTPECRAVTGVRVDVQGTTVLVTWLPDSTALSWEVSFAASPAVADEGTILPAADTTMQFLNFLPGTYDLYVRSLCAEGIYSDWSEVSTFVVEEPPVSVSTVDETLQFELSPNPTAGDAVLSLSGAAPYATVQVVDLYGREVLRRAVTTLPAMLPLEGLPTGIYFVIVTTPSTHAATKLVVQ